MPRSKKEVDEIPYPIRKVRRSLRIQEQEEKSKKSGDDKSKSTKSTSLVQRIMRKGNLSGRRRKPVASDTDSDSDHEWEDFINNNRRMAPKSTVGGADLRMLQGDLNNDAHENLLKKMGVDNLPPPARGKVQCVLVHPLKIRTSQEVWINSRYDSLQFCHTTILISGEIKDKKENAEIQKAYENGGKYVDDFDPFENDQELFMMEYFVSEHVVILRRNCIVQKHLMYDLSDSGTSFKEKLLELTIVDGNGVKEKRDLTVYCTQDSQKTADILMKETSFYFVFDRRPPQNIGTIDDPLVDPNTVLTDIVFQERAIVEEEYVNVVNKIVVPMRNVEKGFMKEKKLKVVSHERTFHEDKLENDGELKVYISATEVVNNRGKVTTTKRVASPEKAARVPAKRRK